MVIAPPRPSSGWVTIIRWTPRFLASRMIMNASAGVTCPVASVKSFVTNHREHFEHLGKELSVARHGDERAVLLAGLDFRFRVVGRHPDDASQVADDVGHIPHRLRIHAADRGIERQPAEYFEPRRRVLARRYVSPAVSVQ